MALTLDQAALQISTALGESGVVTCAVSKQGLQGSQIAALAVSEGAEHVAEDTVPVLAIDFTAHQSALTS